MELEVHEDSAHQAISLQARSVVGSVRQTKMLMGQLEERLETP